MKPPLSRLSFLVLDDNPNMIQIMRTVLKGFGAERIYEASTAAEAFQKARLEAIDMAFIDCNLGGMDGLAFVKLMRTAADSPNAYLPMIMFSAYSEQNRVEAARDAGAHDFLVKPLTPAELHRKVIDVIDHPRPFIRTETFFGPDRRRRDDEDYPGPERRSGPAAEREAAEDAPEAAAAGPAQPES